MKKIFLFLTVFSLAAKIQAEETLFIPQDSRKWTLKGKSELGEDVFLPEGQSFNNWTEALLFYHIPQASEPLSAYFANLEAELTKRIGGLVEIRLLKAEQNFYLVKWWVDKSVPGAQHGLVQIAKSANGVDFLRFTAKNLDNVEKIAPFWENTLEKFRIQPIAKEVKLLLSWDFDGRQWVLNENVPQKNEYILEGGSEINPVESVTIDTYAATKFSPRESFDELIRQLKNEYGESFSYRVLYSNKLSGLLEWKAKDKELPISELVYFSKENPGVSIAVRYRNRGLLENEKNMRIWEKILSNAKFEVSYRYVLRPKNELEAEEALLNIQSPWSSFIIREPEGPIFYYK